MPDDTALMLCQSDALLHYLRGNCRTPRTRAMLLPEPDIRRSLIMTPHRVLGLNALATAGCALGMLATRGTLYTLFGLQTPVLLDVLAVGLLGYAGLLWLATRRPISRQMLMTFTAADALWVVASAMVLVLFWGQFDAIGRLLVIAVALVVEVFATMQYFAAGRVGGRSPQMA
jgi:hypothetical protein